MITLPEAFEQEMKQLLGEEEYEAYRKTFDEAVHRGLRVNNGKISTEEFLRRTDFRLRRFRGSQMDFITMKRAAIRQRMPITMRACIICRSRVR